jgi:hypothetical protein
MITPPAGWQVHPLDDALVLTAPEGADVAVMHYLERVRPLAPVHAVVAAHPAPPGFTAIRRGPIERLTTEEGEHAALVVVEGAIGTSPVECSFGLVFGDDFYARLVAVSSSPAHFAAVRATVRTLIRTDYHVLGRRRRRYVYGPPPGFHAVAGLFDTIWYPLDYPARATSITVAAALPQQPGLRDALVATAEQRRAHHSATPPEPLGTPNLMHGRLYTLAPAADGGRAWIALLEDDAYIYPVRLDSKAAEPTADLAVFAAVLASIEPLPAPQVHGDTGAFGAALGHWIS